MVKRRHRYSRPRFHRRFHRRGSQKIPLLPMVGLGASLATANRNGGFNQIMSGDFEGGLKNLSRELIVNYTGWDYVAGGWNMNRLFEGYGPIVMGIAGHMLATRLGANRYMSKIPLVGKFISL